ncbi:(2Fe-2S)-binding protein, partial [Stigmatella aurantiaca]
MSKAIICSCEDVTADDVRHALAKGYHDVESVKRYTGFGTGICQGKSCLSAVAALVAKEGPLKSPGVLPFTPRPPLYPTELSLFASMPVDEAQAPVGGVPQELGTFPQALRPTTELPQKASGHHRRRVMGLALATPQPARRDGRVVLERAT